MYTAVDFFAGSGLVSLGLKSKLQVIWANDIDLSKSEIYNKNIRPSHFVLGDITKFNIENIPDADLYWASFPCQDLSLAGKQKGLVGERSGLVKEILRIIEKKENRPKIVVFENVFGFLTSHNGTDYSYVHEQLNKLGYISGSLVIDASNWLPQSRVRVFKVAIQKSVDISGLTCEKPLWCHPDKIQNIAKKHNDYILWNIAKPPKRKKALEELIDVDNDFDFEKSKHYLSLVSTEQRKQLRRYFETDNKRVVTGYKRTRKGKQKLELRFDGIAGCLRTASGGSSKLLVLYLLNGNICVRYLRPREAARLMGANDNFWLPENKNDAYSAMGDAVAYPTTKYLTEKLLSELLER
jgi:DNA (cytosine-5)-methyltransferase 1